MISYTFALITGAIGSLVLRWFRWQLPNRALKTDLAILCSDAAADQFCYFEDTSFFSPWVGSRFPRFSATFFFVRAIYGDALSFQRYIIYTKYIYIHIQLTSCTSWFQLPKTCNFHSNVRLNQNRLKRSSRTCQWKGVVSVMWVDVEKSQLGYSQRQTLDRVAALCTATTLKSVLLVACDLFLFLFLLLLLLLLLFLFLFLFLFLLLLLLLLLLQ